MFRICCQATKKDIKLYIYSMILIMFKMEGNQQNVNSGYLWIMDYG